MKKFSKRIGITQRVMQHPSYAEVMDCLDTHWARLLVPLNILPVPLPLMAPEFVPELWEALELDGLILSGGNTITEFADNTDDSKNLSPERDEYEKALLQTAIAAEAPILGICRGLQLMNVYFGGSLEKSSGHSGTRHVVKVSAHSDRYAMPDKVNSYHDCIVPAESLGDGLVALACDVDGNVEAFEHPKHKLLAIMWHPEREPSPSEADCRLIKEHFGIL